MTNHNQDIVYEGWLTKSPPMNRIWKARWRRRWFVLKHSGELPMQYFLKYYTGKDCRKLKGTIDLDQCDQVDAGLRFENSKQNYPHMFDIKTPKRTYYLAADSENEMNKWVDCVCQVCVLKSSSDDSIVIEEEFTDGMDNSNARRRRSMSRKLEPIPDRSCADYYNDTQPFLDSPPVSPTSSVSGPYIPISECVSGKPLNTPKGISDFNNIISRQELLNPKRNVKDCFSPPQQSYKMIPRLHQTICADDISKCDVNKPIALPMPVPPPKAPVERINSLYDDRRNLNPGREDKITNIESAMKMAERRKEAVSGEFYDCPRKVVAENVCKAGAPGAVVPPPPNWETLPESDFSPGDIGSWSVVNRGGKLTTVDSKTPFVTNSLNRLQRQRREPDTLSLRRPVAPPRPPKPHHFAIPEQPSETHDVGSEPSPAGSSVTQDETYDIPRTLQPNEDGSYSNAHVRVEGTVFSYDFSDNDSVHPSSTGETISPRFEGPTIQYTNLPSPLVTPEVATPPAVNRGLKPTRKMSDSGASSEPSPGPYTPSLGPITTSSAEPSPVGYGPPNIDRTLKPKKSLQEGGVLQLARPPEGVRRVRAGPSPTPSHVKASYRDVHTRSPHHDQYNYDRNLDYLPPDSIHYLDLDHDLEMAGSMSSINAPPTEATSATQYNTIDWNMTTAFNLTREQVEEKRKERGTNN